TSESSLRLHPHMRSARSEYAVARMDTARVASRHVDGAARIQCLLPPRKPLDPFGGAAMRPRLSFASVSLCVALGSCCSLPALLAGAADDGERLKVGVQPDGRIVVPTNQVLKPAGTQITFPGRPVDLALCDEGRTVVAKNMKSLVFIDVATAKIKQTLELPDVPYRAFNPIAAMKKPIDPDAKGHHFPDGFSVVGLRVDGDRVFVTDSQNRLQRARRQKDGRYAWAEAVLIIPPKVGGHPFPAGIARQSAEELWVCSSRGNAVQLVNL